MYDQAKAAHRRVLTASDNAGDIGRLYVQLSVALMCLGESDQRTAALKRLADSCETAATALAKGRQSRRNRFGITGSSEKPSS